MGDAAAEVDADRGQMAGEGRDVAPAGVRASAPPMIRSPPSDPAR